MVVINPLVAAAGINAGSGLISGLFGGLQRSVEQANLNAQAFNLKQSILEARDAGKANLGLNIFSPVFSSTTASDLDLGRQAAAQRLKYGELLPKELGLGREQARWQAAFENSADVKEKSRRERMGRLQKSIAALRATPTGMFGPIAQAPIESLMV